MNEGRDKSFSNMRRGIIVSLLIATLVVLADQLTKSLIIKNLDWGEAWNPIPSLSWLVNLTPVINEGGVCGYFQGSGLRFIIIGIVVIGAMPILWRSLPVNRALIRLSLGLLLAGAVGNLLDRMRFGYVIDFVSVEFISWPAFNVSDSAMVIGTGILGYYLFLEEEEQEGKEGALLRASLKFVPLVFVVALVAFYF
jgi:signal peptidase II